MNIKKYIKGDQMNITLHSMTSWISDNIIYSVIQMEEAVIQPK